MNWKETLANLTRVTLLPNPTTGGSRLIFSATFSYFLFKFHFLRCIQPNFLSIPSLASLPFYLVVIEQQQHANVRFFSRAFHMSNFPWFKLQIVPYSLILSSMPLTRVTSSSTWFSFSFFLAILPCCHHNNNNNLLFLPWFPCHFYLVVTTTTAKQVLHYTPGRHSCYRLTARLIKILQTLITAPVYSV